MSGVVLLLIALGAATVVAALRPQADTAVPPSGRLAAVRRRTRRWRWAGLGLGLGVATAAGLSGGAHGRGVMLAAPLLAICVLAGVIVGELRITAPSGATRRVALEVRRIRDYVPRLLGGAVATATVLLGVVLAGTTARGSTDSLGIPGRALFQQCSPTLSQARSPWPGSFYSLPLAAIVLAGLVAAAFALHRVVRRPRQGEDPAVDDTLRRQAAATVTAASGLLVAVPFAGINLFAGVAMLGLRCPPSWWWRPAGWALVALVPALVALAGWCAGVLVSPSRARSRPGAAVRR